MDQEMYIVVTKGLLKYNSSFYSYKKPYAVEYETPERTLMVKDNNGDLRELEYYEYERVYLDPDNKNNYAFHPYGNWYRAGLSVRVGKREILRADPIYQDYKKRNISEANMASLAPELLRFLKIALENSEKIASSAMAFNLAKNYPVTEELADKAEFYSQFVALIEKAEGKYL